MADVAGHAAYVALFIGQLLLARGENLGWAFRFAGEIGWVAIGWHLGLSSVVLWGLGFAVVDLYGTRKFLQKR